MLRLFLSVRAVGREVRRQWSLSQPGNFHGQGCETLEHCGPIGLQEPGLVLHDPNSSAETFVPVGYRPRTLLVVPVP